MKPPTSTPVDCSVCIANFNGIGLINGCIDSVRRQDANLSIEIIVHDDASTDGSAAFIRSHYPDIQIIESAENVGFCIANNRMVQAARGEFVLLLNNDAELFPDAIRSLHDAAQELPDGAILSLPQYDFETGDLIDRGSFVDPFLNPIPALSISNDDVAMVSGACLWIPKNLWDALGGFPDWFGSLAEDLYISLRARLAGHPVRVLAASGFRHRVGHSLGGGKLHKGRLKSNFRRRALSERNKTFVMFMTFPAPAMHLIFPLHLILLLFESSVLSIANRQARYVTHIYFPVISALFEYRRELQQTRRRTMRNRFVSQRVFFDPFRYVPHKLRLLTRHGLPRVI